MPRPKVDINLSAMQTIMDEESNKYNNNKMEYFQHCCNIYNKKYSPPKDIYPQLIYTRVHKTGELTVRFDLPDKNTKSPRVLSPEHKKKWLEGRKATSRKKKKNTNAKHAEELAKYIPNKPNLVKAVLNGSPTAGIKAFCYKCMGEDIKEIRNCTSLRCPLWNFRPFQHSEETGV